jgi:hypothetical protein
MTAPKPSERQLEDLGRAAPAGEPARGVGYHGRAILKPPVWTWEIPLYFFIGGAGGMSAVIALASLASERSVLVARTALWIAAAAALASPLLLISDLGRPARFLHMLRVFKLRSPMSVGVWVLVAFSACAVPAALIMQFLNELALAGIDVGTASRVLYALVVGAAISGAALASYTGVLIGATAIPVWNSHRRLLPIHFAFAGLGSAGAILELAGHRLDALMVIGVVAALVETAVGATTELSRRGSADRAAREGRAGLALRVSMILSGPLALLLRFSGLVPFAAASFLAGALLGRFGWVWAGRQSALDPEALLGSQRR